MTDHPEAPASVAPPAQPGDAAAGIIVTIPGRREHSRIPLVVPDVQTADEIRHLVNGFARRRALDRERERLELLRDEIALAVAELERDPWGARVLEAIAARRAQRGPAQPTPAPALAEPPPAPRPVRRFVARLPERTA